MSIHLEPPPPHETGTELIGTEAATALMTAMHAKRSADVRLSPVNIDTFKDTHWIVIVFRFPKGFSLTWKLSRHFAHVLKMKLDEALR